MTRETTRRRIIQGAGLVGVAGVAGTALVTAQEETPTGDGQSALRVAHASPDAPPVDVLLDDQPVLNALAFGEVSGYNVLEPGSYQLQVATSEQGTILEQEVTVPDGEAVTAVAFGQAEQGVATPTEETATPIAETPTGETPTGETPTEATPIEETPTEATPIGETPTGETPTGETPAGETPTGETPTGGGQGQSRGAVVEGLAYGEAESFTVNGGDYTLLVRPTDEEETPTGETPTGETPTGETPTGETPTGETPTGETPTGETPTGETPTGETPTGETPTDGGVTPIGGTPVETATTTDTDRPFQVALLVDDLTSPPSGQARVRVFHAVPDIDDATVVAIPGDRGQGQGQGQGQGDGPSRSVDVSLQADTVYSGFATGYFEPQAPPTPTDGETRPGVGLVVAETSVDGRRVDGGTDGL